MLIHVDTLRITYIDLYQCEVSMTHKTAVLLVQKWGNSLAVRIPAAIARSAHFHQGMMVELDAHEGSVMVKAKGPRKLTLKERLDSFDPKLHGGEAMPTKPVGLEKL